MRARSTPGAFRCSHEGRAKTWGDPRPPATHGVVSAQRAGCSPVALATSIAADVMAKGRPDLVLPNLRGAESLLR